MISIESIPHRLPFRFVDEIVEVSDKHIVTRWLADREADFFRGHYPQNPVMPGVLLCECCFQAGALLIAHLIGSYNTAQSIPVVTRIQDARFKRVVRPGEQLEIDVTLDDRLDQAYYMKGQVTVVGRPVMRVSFVCMAADLASVTEKEGAAL